MKNSFKFLIAGVLLAFGTVVSASTVAPLPPLVLDFAYAGLAGGDFDGTTVAGEVSGSMTLDQLTVAGGYGTGTGTYDITGGTLTFDTSTDSITITGGVVDLGIALNTELFSGAFSTATYTPGPIEIFQGGGSGAASLGLLTAIGEIDANTLTFYGFTMQREVTADPEVVYMTSTDFILTETNTRTPEVPIPAAAWLFGSGLIGLVGVARRKVV